MLLQIIKIQRNSFLSSILLSISIWNTWDLSQILLLIEKTSIQKKKEQLTTPSTYRIYVLSLLIANFQHLSKPQLQSLLNFKQLPLQILIIYTIISGLPSYRTKYCRNTSIIQQNYSSWTHWNSYSRIIKSTYFQQTIFKYTFHNTTMITSLQNILDKIRY